MMPKPAVPPPRKLVAAAAGSAPGPETSAPPDEEVYFLPISELAARIRAKQLKPTDLVAGCLDRLERLGPRYNAVVTLMRDSALKEASFLLRTLRPEHLPELLEQAIRHGLQGQALGRPIQDWLRDLLAMAQAGLERLAVLDAQGRNETRYLDPLHEIVETGMTQADRLLHAYEHEWRGRLDPLFARIGYPQD